MAAVLNAETASRSALNYGIVGIVVAVMTLLVFLRDGAGAYMIVLFGGGFAAVMLGIAYEKFRASRTE